jgi:hypothetical protein
MILWGSVYQFWRKHKRPPTVGEIAEEMRLSRSTCYWRYTPQDFHKAVLIASGEVKRDLPDLRGLDSTQRASLAAEKPGFSHVQRDFYDKNRVCAQLTAPARFKGDITATPRK